MVGQRFGRLVVEAELPSAVMNGERKKRKQWLCRCDCGRSTTAIGKHLKSGAKKSCGCLRKKIDMMGKSFGMLTVIGEADPYIFSGQAHCAKWRCQCACGNVVDVSGVLLRGGRQKSCGCSGPNTKHSGTRRPEYKHWLLMRWRCSAGPDVEDGRLYRLYRGQGVVVCERWNDFQTFLDDMGPRPTPKHTLDRWPDPYGDYEPGNVRWATRLEQANNRRTSKNVTTGRQLRKSR